MSPLFDIKCYGCHCKKEVLVKKRADIIKEYPKCEKCGEVFYIEFPRNTSFMFKGKGYYSTDNSKKVED